MDFHDALKQNVNYNLPGFRQGLAKKFYEETLYSEMAICINIVEDTSNHILFINPKVLNIKMYF
jgi:DNA helicase II / ATP-dependent DNA helicase PcrA